MPTTIYFVRHGKPHNPKEIFYGRLPYIRLSEEGKQQAVQAGEKLKSKGITAIYTSPMLRTKQTAREISRVLEIESISLSKKIIEVYSHLQGIPISEMMKINWDHYSPKIKTQGDESIIEVLNRLVAFCLLSERRHPNESIVAVSHGDPLMMLKAYSSGIPVDLKSLRPGPEKYISYCGILGLRVEHGTISLLEEDN